MRHLAAGCFTQDGVYGGECVIPCPRCGFDYSHIRLAGTLMDGDEGCLYLGTPMLDVVNERRSAVSIIFGGECGHSWELRIPQHKGINLLEVYMALAVVSDAV